LEEVREKTVVLKLGQKQPEAFQEAIQKAIRVLKDGRVVAHPTESVYGLAVDATNLDAIFRLYALKKRKQNEPVLILTPSIEALEAYAVSIPPIARELMAAFWPGGLTLVFRAAPSVSPLLTAGTGKIGIRLSSHPVASAIASTFGLPITSTSANVSGMAPCSTSAQVLKAFSGGLDLILDGGETPAAKASTVLDVTETPPRVLREGLVSTDQLAGYVS
jgi:L-threonylcarbamoyladenylate synthase